MACDGSSRKWSTTGAGAIEFDRTNAISRGATGLHSQAQRLFAEGDFTASYKFALLISLADLAVELGADDWAELTLTNRCRTDPAFAGLLAKVAAVVSAQPLNYLQNFGGIADPFLYVRSARGDITLLHGVAYCLRRFYMLVQQMSRTRWVEHIKANRRNHAILGDWRPGRLPVFPHASVPAHCWCSTAKARRCSMFLLWMRPNRG